MYGRERENQWEVNTREERRFGEEGVKRSPTEYRDREAVVQTICMNWAVVEKRKQGGG